MAMRVYHFLSKLNAERDLIAQHLKVARINELNDPFELLSCALPERDDRKRFAAFKRKTHHAVGFLCFTVAWDNPLMWSHYADKHKGVCFGFDVPQSALSKVRYTDKRDDLVSSSLDSPELTQSLLTRKFAAWAYECEHRWILELSALDKKRELYFKPFSPELRLAEIVVGPMCDWTPEEIRRTAPDLGNRVDIIRARMAFRSFRIVRNRRGFAGVDPRRERKGHG